MDEAPVVVVFPLTGSGAFTVVVDSIGVGAYRAVARSGFSVVSPYVASP